MHEDAAAPVEARFAQSDFGAALARLEATTAMRVLAERIESFQIVDADSLRYAPSFILRGLEALELDVTYA